MSFYNPFEVILGILLILIAIWMVERIIAKAFKTFVFAMVLFVALGIYTVRHTSDQIHKSKLPQLTPDDLTDWTTLKPKLIPYEKEAVKDIKKDYKEVRKEFR